MKKITPNIDLQNSIQRDRVLESRDFYKGKSFRYSVWAVGHPYHNDEWYIDFVSHEGVLYACKKNHISSTPPSEHSAEWTFVMAGTPGQDGQVYVPAYNESTGELTWTLQDKSSEKITLQLVSKKDIENFVTNEKIANFATQSWVSEQGFLTSIPEEYVTSDELDAKGYLTEHQSLEGYATEEFVTTKINDAQLGQEVDLTNYATKDYVTEKLEDLSSTYATKTEVQNLTIDGGRLEWQ